MIFRGFKEILEEKWNRNKMVGGFTANEGIKVGFISALSQQNLTF